MLKTLRYTVLALSLSTGSLTWADTVQDLQHAWGQANYELQGKDQKEAYQALLIQADNAKSTETTDAGVFIWSGIINSSYAGVKGGLGAMKYAKQAKADLEKAMEIDAGALQGSAYTSLGTLYFKVPGWPIGFGSDDKARELLQQALQLNPDGIDSNYFYADFLYDQGEYDQARIYAEKAMAAPARPDRPVADRGRHQEIGELMAKINKKR